MVVFATPALPWKNCQVTELTNPKYRLYKITEVIKSQEATKFKVWLNQLVKFSIP